MKKHLVYMLRCKDNSLYTGYTTDLDHRLRMHEEGKGAKYTRGRGPFQVMYVEECADKSLALQREAEIKKLTPAQKRNMIISSMNGCLRKD